MPLFLCGHSLTRMQTKINCIAWNGNSVERQATASDLLLAACGSAGPHSRPWWIRLCRIHLQESWWPLPSHAGTSIGGATRWNNWNRKHGYIFSKQGWYGKTCHNLNSKVVFNELSLLLFNPSTMTWARIRLCQCIIQLARKISQLSTASQQRIPKLLEGLVLLFGAGCIAMFLIGEPAI